jgi:hypothetical protein
LRASLRQVNEGTGGWQVDLPSSAAVTAFGDKIEAVIIDLLGGMISGVLIGRMSELFLFTESLYD